MVDRRMLHTNNYLALIQDVTQYLRLNPDPVFSSAEDCDYFRKKFKASLALAKKTTAPSPPMPVPSTPVVFENVLPLPPPQPKIEPQSVIAPAAAPPPKYVPPPLPTREETREETHAPTLLNFGKWKTLIGKIAPEMPILAEIPHDAIAKKIATRWKTKNLSAPITLLSYQEIPEQKAFLEQIAIALDVYFGPAKLVSAETIEKEGQWEAFLSVTELKLVISCDYTLWQMPGLLKFYKETPARRYIGEKDCFLLPDLSLYVKDPLLKRSLWKALCQTCQQLLPASSSTKI